MNIKKLFFSSLFILLSGSGFVQFPDIITSQPVEQENAALRPEEYLVYAEQLPQFLFDKYPGENFLNHDNLQNKLPNLYSAENTVTWSNQRSLKTKIIIGVPGYWDGFYLRGDERFDRVSERDNLGEYALFLESGFEDEVRFIKGNAFVEVSMINGNESSDVLLIAEMIASQLPAEMPHPDSFELIVPEPAKNITMPSKYINQVSKNGEPGIIYFDRPDFDKMILITRYPFTKYTLGLWSETLGAYILLEQKTITYYDLGVLSGEHNARANSQPCGKYELHYWVNGEFAARYAYEIIGESQP